MLISWTHGFLFVHIQKTGGQSIERLLRSHVPDVARHLGTHDHALWAKRQMSAEEWQRLFRFAFVRNPWDRLVSWYTMIREQADLSPPSQLNRLWQYVLSNASNFREFLERCTDTIEDTDGVKSFAYNQLDYIADENGQVIVDFIGRFESFSKDVAEVARHLKIEKYELPSENKSQHDHYSEYYTADTKRLVAKRYARDIEYFDYTFENP
jgi:chondroitin 4-sulfotransferase 11